MPFAPHFLTTVVGSFPHFDAGALCQTLLRQLDVPDWPQLPRRSFLESMYVQYSRSLPGVLVDREKEKITFDTRVDLSPALEQFYEHYLAEDVDAFGLSREYSAGFFAMLEALHAAGGAPAGLAKGQVTGPVSFGLTVTDQDLRASLYNETLADVIVKNMAMNARWQVRQMRQASREVIIFVDEPYMASFGSAFISLDRDQAIAMLDEVFAAVHSEGAIAGVHCCANTDWSVLLGTQVDVLNLDTYGFLENLALYPTELRRFLDRGGVVAWGIVPNNEEVHQVTPESLARRLVDGFALIQNKAAARGVQIDAGEFASRSLVVPSCGLGSTTVEIAGQVLDMLQATGERLKQEFPIASG